MMTRDVTRSTKNIRRNATPASGLTAFDRYAEIHTMTPDELARLLKATAFKNVQSMTITEAQMVALLRLAEAHGIDPFGNTMMAIPDGNGGIVPYLTVDGWYALANHHPGYDHCEFVEADRQVTLVGALPAPAWIACTIYRNDRNGPFTVRERLAENYRESRSATEHGPWQLMPARCLRHKAFVQAARVALSPGALYDEEEARRIAERTASPQTTRVVTSALNTILEQASLHQELAPPPAEFQVDGIYFRLNDTLTSSKVGEVSRSATGVDL